MLCSPLCSALTDIVQPLSIPSANCNHLCLHVKNQDEINEPYKLQLKCEYDVYLLHYTLKIGQ